MLSIKQILASLICCSLLSTASHAEPLNRSFAWSLQVGQLDPHATSSDTLFSLIAHYLAPLIEISPDNRLVPALAESWAISEDGKTITLKLRQDAYWSDGVPITAHQAKQSIERALSPDMASDARLLLLSIKGAQARINGQKDTPLGIQAPDKHTLVFKLHSINPDFLRSLAFPIASPVPMHQINPDDSAYPPIDKLSSSGPYRLIHTEKHAAKFAANEKYYGTPPHFKQVSFNFTQYKALIKSFLNKSYDTLEYIPVDQMPWLKKHLSEAIEIADSNGAFYLVMKHEELGGFDYQLRKLVLESIDSVKLNEIMTRQYFPAMSRLLPWSSLQHQKTVAPLQDTVKTIQQTRQLLEKRGYSAEKPLKACISLRKVATNESLFNFFRAHLSSMHIQLKQSDFPSNLLLDTENLDPKELCALAIDGYGSRTKSDEEMILSFFPGGLFYNFLKNHSDLNQRHHAMSQLTDLQARKAAIHQLENYLLEQYYVKALYKTDLISLVNQQRIGNYSESITHTFIPLSQYLKP